MADENEEKQQEQKQQDEPKPKAEKAEKAEKDEKKGTKSSSFGLYTWLIMAAIVMAGAVGGFALSQLLASTGSNETETAQTDPQDQQTKTFTELLAATPENAKPWPYDLEAVIANLDEPGVTRYVRTTITLELSPEMDQANGLPFLDEKKVLLVDWLTTYLAGLSLEQVRGTSSLSRIKKEIRDHFNELLFPESKPFIRRILIKEFAVQ